MGMYDSIYLEMKCPGCGHVSENELQTKQFECELEVWKKGDFIPTKDSEVHAISDCDKCGEYAHSIIHLDRGIVTGGYVIESHWNYNKHK